jgi:hypothetical protein
MTIEYKAGFLVMTIQVPDGMVNVTMLGDDYDLFVMYSRFPALPYRHEDRPGPYAAVRVWQPGLSQIDL